MPKICIGLGGVGESKQQILKRIKETATSKGGVSDFIIIDSDKNATVPPSHKEKQGGKMDEYALDELINSYIDEEIEFDEVLDFCDELEPTEENKKMLLEAILCFDIVELYETLFCKFDHLLTDEERAFYREKYKRAFG